MKTVKCGKCGKQIYYINNNSLGIVPMDIEGYIHEGSRCSGFDKDPDLLICKRKMVKEEEENK